MHAQRHMECEAGAFDVAMGAQDFSESAHRAKMPRLDFQSAVYGRDTFIVAFQHIT